MATMAVHRTFFFSLLLLWVLILSTTKATDETTTDDTTTTTDQEVLVSIDILLDNNNNIQDREVPSEGEDQNEKCQEWAASGECSANPDYMWDQCAASCYDEVVFQAYVYPGEDAAIGAFRFAEEYAYRFDDLNHNSEKQEQTKTVLQVAKQLADKLKQDASDYKPPKDISHCGKKACSAGKLWKRAEEMRKADMHDAAGSDLIRALLKTGIEIDFIERCQQSLKWAFGSIQRQREREKREAAEEAKLQQRRLEEQQAMDEAMERKKEYEADWVKFGVKVQESVASGAAGEASVGADGTVDVVVQDVIKQVKQTFVAEGPQGGNWNETIQLIKKIPMSDKSIDILLIEARCHDMLGNHKSALSAAGRLVQKAASHEPWINDSPRMMAATLGANAAMQLGLSENALSFYQTVLKYDPEQARARKQYRGLKKVVKLMGKAEEQIQKGYNKAASVHVDDCLSAMRGLDVDSPLFRSKIQLKQCTIQSGMGKHEEALYNCDLAVETRLAHDTVTSESRKEAHLVRGEALLLDMDYDEAVQDFRAAFDLVPEDDADYRDEKRELHHKLQETMHQQEMWNGGRKDHRFNENTGYPDGMPPQRDHAKILQLPIDLEERNKEVKCAWLRKQFKDLVRKYHPDKYKGNKKRAARKFKEVKEAKEIISNDWGC